MSPVISPWKGRLYPNIAFKFWRKVCFVEAEQLFGLCHCCSGFQVALVVKNPSANAGDVRDVGSISWLGRSPGGERGNPLQYSCLENPMDRGAWWVTIHEVAKIWT